MQAIEEGSIDVKKQQIGTVVSKEKFLKSGAYSKEEYEGLLVSADVNNGIYNIGIELEKNRILVVDQARDNEVHQKVNEWFPRIQEVQQMYYVDDGARLQ